MNIENENINLLDSVELEGITQEELDQMSSEDLKAFQRNQSDDEMNAIKKKIEFSYVSVLFFAICAYLLYVSPIYSAYLSIIPAVTVAVFSLRVYVLGVHLNTSKTSRRMLESFFEDIDA